MSTTEAISRPSENAALPSIAALRIVRLPISRINPAPYNPRKQLKPEDPEWKKLERSLDAFGYVDPLVWNERTGNLVGGHQRLAVMLHKGAVAEVDVSVVDLNDTQERLLNIALNRISGAWEQEGLGRLLNELASVSDADLTITGLDEREMEKALAAFSGVDEVADTTSQLDGLEFRVIVDCRDEAHQSELLERFAGEGLTCRALIS